MAGASKRPTLYLPCLKWAWKPLLCLEGPDWNLTKRLFPEEVMGLVSCCLPQARARRVVAELKPSYAYKERQWENNGSELHTFIQKAYVPWTICTLVRWWKTKHLPDRMLYSVVVWHSFMGMSESSAISRDMLVISVRESLPEALLDPQMSS